MTRERRWPYTGDRCANCGTRLHHDEEYPYCCEGCEAEHDERLRDDEMNRRIDAERNK